MNQHLEFETPISELQAKIEELRHVGTDSQININDEISRLETQLKVVTKSIFSSLNSWQIAQLARHPLRPYTKDYLEHIFTDYQELHGDRHYRDDRAIIGGMAKLNDIPVMVIGHQKGRTTKSKIDCNFGMPRPEGYRKALRLMQLAEKFSLPIITFIDTPGAYPGIGAEERNQSEAIAANLFAMSELSVPIICTVIGEGGSGGALAIGVGDVVQMLQYSTYSVISPEGCASILWKNADKASDAAECMGITAHRLHELGLIDNVIPEPLGGAHRDHTGMADTLKQQLISHLNTLRGFTAEELLNQRYQKLMNFGFFKGGE